MTSQPPGWYDDPEDASLLRYWDGILWTAHVVPKSPTAAATPNGAAPGQSPAPTDGGSAWPGPAPAGTAGQRQPVPPQWRPGTGYPPAPRTRDGAVLSGWWRRVGAFVIDWFLVNTVVWVASRVLSLFPAEEFADWWERGLRAGMAGDRPPPIPESLVAQLGLVAVTAAMVYLVYDVVGLNRWGRTPGRWAVGIRVRLNSRPGPLPLEVAIRRSSVKFLGELTAPLPLIGTLTFMFAVLDRLWPLRDPERQSLHDKVASTVVVVQDRP